MGVHFGMRAIGVHFTIGGCVPRCRKREDGDEQECRGTEGEEIKIFNFNLSPYRVFKKRKYQFEGAENLNFQWRSKTEHMREFVWQQV